MKLFGYVTSDAVKDAKPAFDDFIKPFFYKGDRVGCLVLHGIGGTPANVRVVADALARAGHTVYAPLLPGHGTTVRAFNESADWQWLRAAEAGYDKLRRAGCAKVFLVGLSLGGILSGLLAERRSCAGLVLLSAPIRLRPYLKTAALLSPVAPYVRHAEPAAPDAAIDPAYAQMYDGFSTRKLWDLMRLIRRLNANLSEIRCPVLAVWAERDNKVDAQSPAILRRGLKNAKLTELTLAGSPHGSTYGPAREAAADAVCAFVETVLAGQPI